MEIGRRVVLVALLVIGVAAIAIAQTPPRGTETQQLARQVLELQKALAQAQFGFAQCELRALDIELAKAPELAK